MNVAAIILFCAGAAGLLYALFGYPLLVDFLARRGHRPVRKDFERLPNVSILMAVYNGEPWIRAKLESILKLDYPRERVQILVVSDESNDGTDAIVREFEPQGVQLLRIAKGGKAAALNAAMEQARGEILFFTDVRQPLDPRSLRELVACFGDPEVGAASGELFILSGTSEEASVGLYWRYEKWIRKSQSDIDSVIGATGCIYAMRRELAEPMPANTLLDDVYLPLKAFFRGYRVVLESGAHAFDTATSLDAEFRRKVRTLAGNYQVLREFPALLTPANRMWFHFLSHKVARLLLPYDLLLIAAASLGLPEGWAGAAIAGQAGFYALAAADLLIPDGFPLKRLTSLARTFVVLVAASFCAIAILFNPSTEFWKPAQGKTVFRRTEDRRGESL